MIYKNQYIAAINTPDNKDVVLGFWGDDVFWYKLSYRCRGKFQESQKQAMYAIRDVNSDSVVVPENSRYEILVNDDCTFDIDIVTPACNDKHFTFRFLGHADTDLQRKLAEIYELPDMSASKSLFALFYGQDMMTVCDVSDLNTSNCEDFSCMFRACEVLPIIDVSGFNTSRATDMAGMFMYCSTVEQLNVSNFDTSKVKNMSHMFDGCQSLTELDLSSFNTANCEDFSHMFAESKFTSLDVSGFNTANATHMTEMFRNLNQLQQLDLSNFNFEKVTDARFFITQCPALTSITFGTVKINGKSNTINKFINSNDSLTTVTGNFDFGNIGSDYIFINCPQLTNVYGTVTNLQGGVIRNCPLSLESALKFIDALVPRETNKNFEISVAADVTIPPEKIAEASAKGWTLIIINVTTEEA